MPTDTHTSKREALATLQIQNSAVSTSLASDANHKTVNALLLNLIANDSLSTNDWNTLRTVAALCPETNGDAVYEARALVGARFGSDFDDEQLCAVEERGRARVAANNSVVLYPNPSTGMVYWKEYAGQTLTAQVYNSYGQLLVSQKTTANQLDLSQLPEGVYRMQLLDAAGQSLAVRAVVLLKH